MMVASVAIHDVEILNLLEVVLGGIGCIDAGYTWVETTAQDSCETSLLETLTIGPLPGILKVCLVLWLVVGCVEIAAATGQTGIHDGQVLIGEGEVDDEFRLVAVEKCLQLLHVVSINLCCLNVHLIASLMDILHNLVTLSLTTTGNHKIGKHVSILCDLECCYRSDASSANH